MLEIVIVKGGSWWFFRARSVAYLKQFARHSAHLQLLVVAVVVAILTFLIRREDLFEFLDSGEFIDWLAVASIRFLLKAVVV